MLLQKKDTLFILIPILFLTAGFRSDSQGKSYNMFYIGRSKDANIIKYDVNLTSEGTIDQENPIKVYWVKKEEGGKVADLTYTQKRLAYGIKYLSKSDHEIKFRFVSYKKQTFLVKKTKAGIYKTYSSFQSKNVEIKKMFIQIDGGTFMEPKISHVKIYWRDPDSGSENTETIHP